MIRILFIARYRDPVMTRKVDLLARQPDLTLCHVYPAHWQDDLLDVDQPTLPAEEYRQIALPMIGRTSDPHRALYRSLLFGMRGFRPDIVHAEEEPDSLTALQIALARSIAAPRARFVLYTWQNVDRPKRWYVRLVMRLTLQASDYVLCANRGAVDLLRRQSYTKWTGVLPAIGVDTGTFVPVNRPTEASRAFVVGYIGRLVPEKGLDVLIAAVARLREDFQGQGPRPLELRFIGDGPERERLAETVRSARLADVARFLPAVPPAQVARQMGELDVLVLPSRSTPVWQEQFGRVLVEAMACRVPVVGSASGAIPEVVDDAGLLFPEGDAEALAQCLRRLIGSPDLYSTLAERGYDRVQHLYTQERIAAQTADFYRRIVR